MLPIDSKYVSIKFAEQCIHIVNNKDKLNELKGNTKMKKRELLFKYQSRFKTLKGTTMLITEV